MAVDADLWTQACQPLHQALAERFILGGFSWKTCNEVHIDFLEFAAVFYEVGDSTLYRSDIVFSTL